MLSIPFTLLCTCAIHFHSPYFSRDSKSRQGRLNSPFFGGHSRVAPEKRRNGARLSLSVCLSVWLFGDSSRRRRSIVPFCAHPVAPSSHPSPLLLLRRRHHLVLGHSILPRNSCPFFLLPHLQPPSLPPRSTPQGVCRPPNPLTNSLDLTAVALH